MVAIWTNFTLYTRTSILTMASVGSYTITEMMTHAIVRGVDSETDWDLTNVTSVLVRTFTNVWFCARTMTRAH